MTETPTSDLLGLIERLESLREKATEGEWQIYKHAITKAEDAMKELVYQVIHTDPMVNHLVMLNASGKCPAITGCGPTSEANAALIVETINALPTLLSALRRVAPVVEALEAALPILEADHEQACELCDADWEGMAYERLEKARAALAAFRASTPDLP